MGSIGQLLQARAAGYAELWYFVFIQWPLLVRQSPSPVCDAPPVAVAASEVQLTHNPHLYCLCSDWMLLIWIFT
jgi:hypothetical protein